MDKRYLVGVGVQATSEAVQFLANVGKPYPGLIYFPMWAMVGLPLLMDLPLYIYLTFNLAT